MKAWSNPIIEDLRVKYTFTEGVKDVQNGYGNNCSWFKPGMKEDNKINGGRKYDKIKDNQMYCPVCKTWYDPNNDKNSDPDHCFCDREEEGGGSVDGELDANVSAPIA